MIGAAIAVMAGLSPAGVSEILRERNSQKADRQAMLGAEKDGDVGGAARIEKAEQVQGLAGKRIEKEGVSRRAGEEKSAKAGDGLEGSKGKIAQIAQQEIA